MAFLFKSRCAIGVFFEHLKLYFCLNFIINSDAFMKFCSHVQLFNCLKIYIKIVQKSPFLAK